MFSNVLRLFRRREHWRPLGDREFSEQMRRDYFAVFSTEAGQRVLEDMAIRAGVTQPVPLEQVPALAGYWEGRRSVVVEVLNMLYQPPPPKPEDGDE